VATHELTRILGEDAVRAESKFVAYRLPAFADMRWRSDLVGEDHQLAAFAFERALRVRSAFDARVLVTPARGYTDFYTQTYRHFGTRRAARAYTSRPMPRPQPRDRARGLARAARHDPAGAVAYAAARMAAAFRHRVAPIELFPPGTWVSAPSTKGRRRAAGAG
jgi:hypothetical protein